MPEGLAVFPLQRRSLAKRDFFVMLRTRNNQSDVELVISRPRGRNGFNSPTLPAHCVILK